MSNLICYTRTYIDTQINTLYIEGLPNYPASPTGLTCIIICNPLNSLPLTSIQGANWQMDCRRYNKIRNCPNASISPITQIYAAQFHNFPESNCDFFLYELNPAYRDINFNLVLCTWPFYFQHRNTEFPDSIVLCFFPTRICGI